MKAFTDMMDREITVSFPPQRIVSVVPSQTELLYELGLNESVAGITKFCVHPDKWFREKVRIGGTKKLNLDRITALNPDLIIANKEENTRQEIEFLAQHFPVWISDITTIDDGLEMIKRVGALTGKEEHAQQMTFAITQGMNRIQKAKYPVRVAYFIWRNPWMTIGKDTFIHDMICRLGWINVYAEKNRYPETSFEALQVLSPEVILLSSEPYPFKEQHIAELQLVVPQARILLVDGEMFSWYGSRMLHAVPYLEKLVQTVYR